MIISDECTNRKERRKNEDEKYRKEQKKREKLRQSRMNCFCFKAMVERARQRDKGERDIRTDRQMARKST